MGMSIDKTIEFFNGLECHTPQAKDARDVAIDTMRKYQMMQADYNARLKADMLSMLYKLRSEIMNMPKYFPYADHTRWFIDGDVFGLIDKEINALRENEDGKIN